MEKRYTVNKIVKMKLTGLKSSQTIKKLIENGNLKAIDVTTNKNKQYLVTEKDLNTFLKTN